MPNTVENALDKLSTLNGFISSALVDSQTGSIFGMRRSPSHPEFNIEVAAAGNSKVMIEKLKTIEALNLNDSIEDIVIILGHQLHIIHPLLDNSGVFFYCVLERNESDIKHVRTMMSTIIPTMNIQAITI